MYKIQDGVPAKTEGSWENIYFSRIFEVHTWIACKRPSRMREMSKLAYRVSSKTNSGQ